MHSKKTEGQEWSIRAEFTASPHRICASEKSPVTNTTQEKNGIRLSFCWRSNENPNIAAPTSYRAARYDSCRPKEYQKGSLTFTSTPPFRLHTATTRGSNFELQDSGYGSDLLSLNSLPRESPIISNNSNNRKCRSTCSIVLCSNISDKIEQNSSYTKDGRINSLRYQLPPVQNNSFHACGDPCCDHIVTEENEYKTCRGVGTQCQSPNTFLPNYKLCLPSCKSYKRDVSIQTSDSLQKCSDTNLAHVKTKMKSKNAGKTKLKKNIGSGQSLSLSAPRTTGEKVQASSSRQKHMHNNYGKSDHTSDSSKKSRTIHIDVYCTDTDLEASDASSDSWENETASTPQTIFESENVCVTHENARCTGLPFKLKRYSHKKIPTRNTSIERNDSDLDDDDVSTNYPSKIDSYSTINDFSSSISSIKSWKNYSLSSCPNDCEYFNNFSMANIPSSMGKPLYANLKNTGNKSKMTSKAVQDLTTYELQNTRISQNFINNSLVKQSCDRKIEHNNEHLKERILTDSGRNTFCYDGDIVPQTKFSAFQGQYTEQIASRFGKVNLYKKPGHHMGPIKNPHCCCDHCRRYYSN